MKRYVLGFMFGDTPVFSNTVAMIRKQKPEWQKGLLNGIGGKIENGEIPYEAMIREFKEETGFEQIEWTECGVMTGKDWEVICWACTGDLTKLRTMEEEEIVLKHVNDVVSPEFIDNIKWLVPMCLYAVKKEQIKFSINYPDHE